MKVALFFLLCSFPLFAFADWKGAVVMRHRIFNFDNGLNSRDGAGKNRSEQKTRAWDMRSHLHHSGAFEKFGYTVGLRTSNAIVNDFVLFQDGQDRSFALELAFVSYKDRLVAGDLSVFLGRQAGVFQFEKAAQQLYDSDVRWDGLGLTWTNEIFGLNAAYYVIGAKSLGSAVGASTYNYTEATQSVPTTRSAFAYQIGVQPFFRHKFNDEIEGTLALGLYRWANSEGYNNTVHGFNTSTLDPSADNGTIKVDNPKQWHLFHTLSLPLNLLFAFEYIKNKEIKYNGTDIKADADAFLFGLTHSNAKKGPPKSGDYSVSYYYNDKGLASVLNSTTNGGIPGDMKGHLIYLRYVPVNQVNLGAVAYFMDEKSRKNSSGITLSTSQKTKIQHYYLFAGVAF